MTSTAARSASAQAGAEGMFPLGKPGCDYQALRRESEALARADFPLTVVIPAQLDPLRWPATNPDGTPKTGPSGQILPAFVGRNPSCWDRSGQPRLLSPARTVSPRDVMVYINTAERLGFPIGLAIVAGDRLAAIDLDAKHYPDGADGVTAELTRLLSHHPDLAGTRIERTPSGGAHIFVALSEAERQWLKGSGRQHGFNLTTAYGGPQRGELLHGNRIAVTAPTQRHDGAYSLLVADHAYSSVEIKSLEVLGIVPASKTAAAAAAPRERPRIELPDPPCADAPSNPGGGDGPPLAALLGKHARAVLAGLRPYGEDRSSNLAGLAREAYGWQNWLQRQGLPAVGTAADLIAEAVEILGIGDKAERVLATIDEAACDCCNGDARKASNRYRFHQKQVQGPGPEAGSADPQPGQKQATDGGQAADNVVPLAALKARIARAVADGISGADLALLSAELGEEHNLSPLAVQRIADAIQKEQGQAAEIAAEAATIASAARRQAAAESLTAEYLLPPALARALSVRTRYLPCDGPSAVVPFLAAVAGMVRLGTQVEASRVAGYAVPVNLFGGLVGRSGTMKSPVNRTTVEHPTHGVRLQLAQQNDRAVKAWEEQNRGVAPKDRTPMPEIRRLMVSEATGEAIAAQLQIQESAGLGLLIYRDELAGLFGGLNAYKAGRGSDEQQLLELFDGGGTTVLRVGESRHYNRSQVSIWGSTQPDVLSQLVSKGDANGLWARFLWAPLPEREAPLPLSTTVEEVEAVEAAAQMLADACATIHALAPRTYRLKPAAAERFAHYHLQKQRAALAATIGAHGSLHGKAAGKCLRVAGLLHLLSIAAGAAADEGAVELESIERAAALVDHLDSWALSLHEGVAIGGATDVMRTIHRIASNAGKPVRWREIQQKLGSAQRKSIDAGTAREAMEALAAAGYGVLSTGARGTSHYQAEKPLP